MVRVQGILHRERRNHIAGAVKTADIPMRVCKESDFQGWSHGPEMLHSRESEVKNFGAKERLKQVERLMGGEAKDPGGRKGKLEKSKNDVINAVVAEHVEFEKVECNHINENNIHKIIEITRYSSFKKLIVVTCYLLRFIKNNSNKINKIREQMNVDEYNIALKLWIKKEQSLLKFETNFNKLYTFKRTFRKCY